MTKTMFFDTGPIISLIMARLWWVLPKLKVKFEGQFYITPAVYRELIERPLKTKRFKFEALQALRLVREGTLEVYDKIPVTQVKRLTSIANSSFTLNGKAMDILQQGEMEAIAAAIQEKAVALVVDERTLRLFMEQGKNVKSLLEHRFKKKVVANPEKIRQFNSEVKGVPLIRSVELVSVAYKMGLLDGYVAPKKGGRAELLDSVLWAVKINGAAVTEHEIEELKVELLRE
jgi:hypothetical protein